MKRDDIARIIKARQADFEALGVTSLSLFGSAARDELKEGSDIDVLVTFAKTPTFSQYMDVKFLLEDLLGRPVDMGQPEYLKPRIKAKVLSEAVRVA